LEKVYIITAILSIIFLSSCTSENDSPNSPSTRGNISGIITEQGPGDPVSGVSISTQPATTTVTSDSLGNYTISNIEAGIYIVTAAKNGYLPSNVNANINAGQTTTANIIITSTQNIPIASFNYSGILVTPAIITFNNTSQNADSYFWEFGDGTTSTEVNPNKIYNQRGNYSVTLTALNDTANLSNQTSQVLMINPGKVFLQAVTITSFPIRNESGEFWDIDSYPDVYFTVSDSSSIILSTENNYYENLNPTSLPATWTYISGVEFLNWSTTYYIDLWDYDSVSSSDYMGSTNGFKFSQFVTYPTSVQLQSSNGLIRITITLIWQ